MKLLGRAIAGIAVAGLLAALADCGTTPLPPGTSLDAKYHLLASSNFRAEGVQRTRLIVTGMPEGANKISDSANAYLDDFFRQQNAETAYGQIYAPFVLGNWSRYRDYLEHALESAGRPVDLLVYSAGAFSLLGLPEKYWGAIRSLTFASPLVGRDALTKGQGGAQRIMAALIGSRLPTADAYISSIDGLLERLLADGVSVKVSLGSLDTLLDNRVIADAFQRYNSERTRIPVETVDRPHGLTAGQVNHLFEESSTVQNP